jgi:hypothetical protein
MVSSTSRAECRRLAQKTTVGGGAEKKARALPSGPASIKCGRLQSALSPNSCIADFELGRTVVSTVETDKVDGGHGTLALAVLLDQELARKR